MTKNISISDVVTNALKPGDTVYVVIRPDGEEWLISKGTFTQHRGDGSQSWYVSERTGEEHIWFTDAILPSLEEAEAYAIACMQSQLELDIKAFKKYVEATFKNNKEQKLNE